MSIYDIETIYNFVNVYMYIRILYDVYYGSISYDSKIQGWKRK